MTRAIELASLIGLHVEMQRQADEVEYGENQASGHRHPELIKHQGIVTKVQDFQSVGGDAVKVFLKYARVDFVVVNDINEWTLAISSPRSSHNE